MPQDGVITYAFQNPQVMEAITLAIEEGRIRREGGKVSGQARRHFWVDQSQPSQPTEPLPTFTKPSSGNGEDRPLSNTSPLGDVVMVKGHGDGESQKESAEVLPDSLAIKEPPDSITSHPGSSDSGTTPPDPGSYPEENAAPNHSGSQPDYTAPVGWNGLREQLLSKLQKEQLR